MPWLAGLLAGPRLARAGRSNMRTSKKGIDLIKGFEGFRAEAYKCPAGVWTVGYGTTKNITAGMVVTETQAENLLKDHLEKTEDMLTALNLYVTQSQFDALMSFVYNCGIGAFRHSGLFAAIKNNPDGADVEHEWLKWTKAGGKELAGLVKRRKKELELYKS